MPSHLPYQRILVSGASGFIGSNLSRALMAKGYSVIAQYRRAQPPPHLLALQAEGAKLIRADLCQPDSCSPLVKGVDVLIHVAALASDWGSYEAFYEANFKTTVNLCQAALQAQVKRLVYISSITVHGFGNHLDSTEEGPYYPLQFPYPRTKKMAEDYVLSLNQKGFSTVVVRPGNVYGPGDTTTFYPMFRYIQKGFMGYVAGGKTLTCPIYIDDLVAGIMLAMETEKAAGEIYNLTSGEKVSWREVVDFLYQELKVAKKPLSSPVWLSLFLAYIYVFFYRLLGIPKAPPLTPYRIKQAAHNYSFSIAKASRELGFKPKTNWQVGMQKTIRAYLSNTPLA